MTGAGDVLAPGTRLDELEIERVLGAGGFGVTYLARDLSLDTWRAVKEYLPRDWGTRRGDGTIGPRTGSDAEDYQWGLERFLAEARTLARFDHRNLVRVYRVFEARGTAYMVMEYVEGRTLQEEVEESGPLPETRVREVLAALTEGLAKVHGAELLHRDIKPENVMLRPDGTPVLIDFGSARQAMSGHSRPLTAVLTPGYAPIEQYSARGHQGPWTDIYALGATAYWALSGEVPEEATTRVRGDRLLPVSQAARVRVSARLAAAVDAALAVDEADRPQSLEEWRAMLERPVKPPEELPKEPPKPPRQKAGRVVGLETSDKPSGQVAAGRRRRLGLVAAAGLAVAALVVALIVQRDGSVTEEDPAGGEAVVVPRSEEKTSGESGALEGGAGREEEIGSTVLSEPGNEEDQGAAIEAALRLDRAVRRTIQEGLAAAGFDPGGADGRFGQGTRSALRTWQTAQGVEATGYLTATSAAELREAGEALLAARRRSEQACAGMPRDTACWMEVTNRPGCYVWSPPLPVEIPPHEEFDPESTLFDISTRPPSWGELLRLGPDFEQEPRPDDEATATWTGECSGGLTHGTGTLTWNSYLEKRVDEGSLREGKRHGHWVERGEEENLSQGPYVEGERHGHWVEQDDNFTIEFGEGPYVEGKREGQWVERGGYWDYAQGPYVRGKRHGDWVLRDEGGSTWEGPYVEGKHHGHWVERAANGDVSEGPYVNGLRHGQWVFRASDGLTFTITFVKGVDQDPPP